MIEVVNIHEDILELGCSTFPNQRARIGSRRAFSVLLLIRIFTKIIAEK